MKRGTALLLLSFVLFSFAMLGHSLGLITLQVTVLLLNAAMIMLSVFLGIIILGWVPVHDMIQRIRQSVWCFHGLERLHFVDDDFYFRSLTTDSPPPRNSR